MRCFCGGVSARLRTSRSSTKFCTRASRQRVLIRRVLPSECHRVRRSGLTCSCVGCLCVCVAVCSCSFSDCFVYCSICCYFVCCFYACFSYVAYLFGPLAEKHRWQDVGPDDDPPGYDTARPLPGICIHYASAEQTSTLQTYNRSFAEGSDLYPPVRIDQMKYGTLASSHLNLLLRCYESNMVSSVTGRRFDVGLACNMKFIRS